MAINPGPQFLYHGTNVDFNPGDIVNPGKDFSYAYATSDHTLARNFGEKVYQVEPVDEKEARETTAREAAKWKSEMSADNKSVVQAEKGFRVIKRHNPDN